MSKLPIPKKPKIDTQSKSLEKKTALNHDTKKFIGATLSESTKRVYQYHIKAFETWCLENNQTMLPSSPETLANFLASSAKSRKPATVGYQVAAIKYLHYISKYSPCPTQSPEVKETLRGIKRLGDNKVIKKAPATSDIIKQLLKHIPTDTNKGIRDRAMILLGFSGALRRSELVNIHLEDIEFVPEGLLLSIPKSKTDQFGEGQTIPIIKGHKHCPVDALSNWLDICNISKGKIFHRVTKYDSIVITDNGIHDITLARTIKQYVGLAGLDDNSFSGHSLRRGFLTSAAANGATIFKMQSVSRHKSMQVLSEYIDDAKQFDDHAGDGLL